MLKVQRRETQGKGVALIIANNVCIDLCLKDCLGKVKLNLVIDDTIRSTEIQQLSKKKEATIVEK